MARHSLELVLCAALVAAAGLIIVDVANAEAQLHYCTRSPGTTLGVPTPLPTVWDCIDYCDSINNCKSFIYNMEDQKCNPVHRNAHAAHIPGPPDGVPNMLTYTMDDTASAAGIALRTSNSDNCLETGPVGGGACPAGQALIAGKCHRVYTAAETGQAQMTYAESQAFCAALPTSLTSGGANWARRVSEFHTDAERQALFDYLNGVPGLSGPNKVHLGATRSGGNGSPFSWGSTAPDSNLATWASAWDSGEPGSTEQCINFISASAVLNDHQCQSTASHIYEATVCECEGPTDVGCPDVAAAEPEFDCTGKFYAATLDQWMRVCDVAVDGDCSMGAPGVSSIQGVSYVPTGETSADHNQCVV